ncbi:hypothetical protein RHODGE_RHODGE_02971 [Rhodoplanes serenus]|jgi:hypothetical protein|uniref:DUF2842 domain-containing protein n=1 Tax=Rhodoplanes serenus TaxID=200615 RepID=A0A447CWY0_9BRAD|nr:DUF2842 domain-containing protein [Rhodoplanes serenus]VCU09799.1 hypothetical protein RHODGE_RHODGE_02971 [Rhodoplanes serenus]
MHIRYRRLVGVFALVALFLVWGFLALGVGYFLLGSPEWWVRMTYYAIAGAGWLPFAMPIVSFMSRRRDEPA